MNRIITMLALLLLLVGCKAQATHNGQTMLANGDSVALVEPASQQDAGFAASNETPADTTSATGFVGRIGGWYTDHLSYWSVSLLMALESSFIPFPSEIVVPPAAYAACNEGSSLHTTDSKPLNVLFVVLFATLGALIGALINYAIAFFLGRPFVYWFADSKVGHICMLNGEKVKKAEDYFVAHGNSSTLVGRLIPVIRQLISIPAGLAKMRLIPFVGYTTLGALAWNILLAILGYVAHGQKDLIERYNSELTWILLAAGILFILYLVVKGVRKKKSSEKNN